MGVKMNPYNRLIDNVNKMAWTSGLSREEIASSDTYREAAELLGRLAHRDAKDVAAAYEHHPRALLLNLSEIESKSDITSALATLRNASGAFSVISYAVPPMAAIFLGAAGALQAVKSKVSKGIQAQYDTITHTVDHYRKQQENARTLSAVPA